MLAGPNSSGPRRIVPSTSASPLLQTISIADIIEQKIKVVYKSWGDDSVGGQLVSFVCTDSQTLESLINHLNKAGREIDVSTHLGTFTVTVL